MADRTAVSADSMAGTTWYAAVRPPFENSPSHGIHEFLHELSGELRATEESARWDASAVLSTTADAVSGGELNQILSQLPAAYAPLFGKADLA
jgi:uncharacterized protein (DUF2267 family)